MDSPLSCFLGPLRCMNVVVLNFKHLCSGFKFTGDKIKLVRSYFMWRVQLSLLSTPPVLIYFTLYFVSFLGKEQRTFAAKNKTKEKNTICTQISDNKKSSLYTSFLFHIIIDIFYFIFIFHILAVNIKNILGLLICIFSCCLIWKIRTLQ